MSEPEPLESKPPVSRRDFLRTAGAEAARTGVRLVPGASLVQGGTTPWWDKLVRWRRDRGAEKSTTESKESPDDDASPLP